MRTDSLAGRLTERQSADRQDRVSGVRATSGAEPRSRWTLNAITRGTPHPASASRGADPRHPRTVSTLPSVMIRCCDHSSFARAVLAAAFVLPLFGLVAGCSSGETPQAEGETALQLPGTQDAPAESPMPDSTTQPPAATNDSTMPAADEPLSQQQEARTAFRTMTSPGGSTQQWEAAHQKLQEIGEPALPVLIEGLQHEETVKREMASTVLALFGPAAEPAADKLIVALNDESIFVRANVAAALLQMPEHVDRVVPVLAEFLASDEVDLRRMAATNLAAVEVEQARPLMPQLIVALDDSDREVVYYAVQLIGRMGPAAAEALPKLRSLESDDDPELTSAVATAILQISAESELKSRPDDLPADGESDA
jgi:HEAT repeat protein